MWKTVLLSTEGLDENEKKKKIYKTFQVRIVPFIFKSGLGQVWFWILQHLVRQ